MRSLVLIACLLVASAVEAANLYVNNSGSPACSDATAKASNSAASPWCTIGRAAWGSTNRAVPDAPEAADDDDIVLITAGTYDSALQCTTGPTTAPTECRERVLYQTANSGTSGHQITFQGVGVVTLTSSPGWYGPAIGCAGGRNYITWKGFTIDEANFPPHSDTGVAVGFATSCIFEENIIDGNGGLWNDNHNGIRFEGCVNCVARNNTIRNVCRLATCVNVNGAAIMLYHSDDTLIEHNLLEDSGSGIFVKGSDVGTEHANLRTIARYNWIDGMLSEEGALVTSHSTDGRYYQNVIANSQFAFWIYGESAEFYRHPEGDWIYNNTAYNTGAPNPSSPAICVNSNGETWFVDVLLWNNICHTQTRVFQMNGGTMPATSALSSQHAAYFTFTSSFYQGGDGTYATLALYRAAHTTQDIAAPASVSADPLFADAAGGNFRLCTGVNTPVVGCSGASPALSLGVDPSDGVTLRNAGAYLTADDCIGLESNCDEPETPAPVRLRITPPDFGMVVQ